MAGKTVDEKVGDWWTAYSQIRDVITPEAFRAMASLAGKTADDDEPTMNINTINVGMAVARIVFANDRAAATVAAMLVGTGIKPTPMEFPE